MGSKSFPARPGIAGDELKLCVLGSGSKGQSVYVEAGATKMLFDAGFSALALKNRLASIDVDISDIRAVVVSHEHTDHVGGLRVMGRKYPVHATAGTIAQVSRRFELRGAETILAGEWVEAGDIRYVPIPLSHDAADPVGFVIEDGVSRVAIVTDLGTVTRNVLHHLGDLDLLVLESNHDKTMLIEGPYRWDLKQRIQGRHGHLSNEQSAKLLAAIASPRLKTVLLAHLSETNNRPDLAAREACRAMDGLNCGVKVCCQDMPGPVIELG